MDAKKVNGSGNGNVNAANEWRVKVGLAEMLKGGVIMDVTNAEQAKIAENAGACAVMALERVPSDIRKEGGVARMANVKIIREIMATVTIPVMAKVRIGHFAEAEVLQALEVDFIDESEVLTPADEENHIWKHDYRVPFVCGARNLGEALRRVAEGAAMIRTKGEAGSGNVVEAVRHMRTIVSQMKRLTTMRDDELMREAKELGAPLDLIRQVAKTGKLPVPNFSAGGGNFQVERPGSARESGGESHHAFRGREGGPRGQRRVGRSDARARRTADGSEGHAVNARLVTRCLPFALDGVQHHSTILTF